MRGEVTGGEVVGGELMRGELMSALANEGPSGPIASAPLAPPDAQHLFPGGPGAECLRFDRVCKSIVNHASCIFRSTTAPGRRLHICR